MLSDNQTFFDRKIKRRKGKGDDNKVIRRNSIECGFSMGQDTRQTGTGSVLAS